jgi:hypothetical protein
MKNEEQIANTLMLWLTFIGILFGVAILGLTLSIIKGILLICGIETNL